MNTKIIINLQVEGMHSWPEAKTIMPQMSFLSSPHRHIFYIECQKSVNHWDRDIEIIDFKRKVISFLDSFYEEEINMLNFENYSCEKLGELILKEFDCDSVKVLEDNENGAIVTK